MEEASEANDREEATRSHICKFCNKDLTCRAWLLRHLRVHTGEKPYSCRLCRSKFALTSALVKHQLVHTSEKPFKCSQCSYSAKSASSINAHLLITHSEEKPFSCPHPNCQFSCKRNRNLQLHILRLHDRENVVKSHKCPFCDYSSMYKGPLNIHIRTHTGEKYYKCPFAPEDCNYSAGRSSHLKNHIALRHSDVRNFPCHLCPFQSKLKQGLEYHIRIVHSAQRPFDCPFPDCGKSFKTPYGLKVHCYCHAESKTFGCNFCPLKFKCPVSRRNHVRMIHSDLQPNFICLDCPYRGKTAILLRNHTKQVHGEERPFVCQVCGHAVKIKATLTAHMNIHGEKNIQCPLCDYRTNVQGMLNNHMRIHTGEKPYKCTFDNCHRDFHQHSHLKRHEKVVHTGEKLHKCSICQYTCVEPRLLRDHMKKHAKRQKFKCRFCSYSASRPNYTTQHETNHHHHNDVQKKDTTGTAKKFDCLLVGDKCKFSCQDEMKLVRHFSEVHKMPIVILEKLE